MVSSVCPNSKIKINSEARVKIDSRVGLFESKTAPEMVSNNQLSIKD